MMTKEKELQIEIDRLNNKIVTLEGLMCSDNEEIASLNQRILELNEKIFTMEYCIDKYVDSLHAKKSMELSTIKDTLRGRLLSTDEKYKLWKNFVRTI